MNTLAPADLDAEPARTPVPGGQWLGPIKLDELADYLERNGLRVVGGDPDVGGDPWRPVLYLAPRVPAAEKRAES